jgi:hypothetical protein
MSDSNELTARELNEVFLAMYYTSNLKHGTDGHNRLVLISKLATACGFSLVGQELHFNDEFQSVVPFSVEESICFPSFPL